MFIILTKIRQVVGTVEIDHIKLAILFGKMMFLKPFIQHQIIFFKISRQLVLYHQDLVGVVHILGVAGYTTFNLVKQPFTVVLVEIQVERHIK